ncbi:MAG: hypothetical protein CMJ64_10925 [Planctomycetaceae bacterium]|nr:hypothetical protein [Planctomycetaceae bacterium]
MHKSLDNKIQRILQDSSVEDFIIADAKDADMGLGLAAPGVNLGDDRDRHPFRSLASYRESMRQITKQGLVDIMLVSASTSEILTIQERLFEDSSVTPAVRANDTTDIWLGESGDYKNHPSLCFNSATIQQIMHGTNQVPPDDKVAGADLGLYSITFNNDPEIDREAVATYAEFRLEAEQVGFRHFLEVFTPNAPTCEPDDIPRFVNDSIVRTLAGVPSSARPLFLKMPYYGPAAMEQLAYYDPNLIPGILGGPSGTTHDAFRMLWEAKRYGARAALFGRKINNAEAQLAFVEILRALADGNILPEQAVREYHGRLQAAHIAPHRSLEDDLELTQLEAG